MFMFIYACCCIYDTGPKIEFNKKNKIKFVYII